jgi:plastocyanin
VTIASADGDAGHTFSFAFESPGVYYDVYYDVCEPHVALGTSGASFVTLED